MHTLKLILRPLLGLLTLAAIGAAYSVGITVLFLFVGWAVLAVGNRRQRN